MKKKVLVSCAKDREDEVLDKGRAAYNGLNGNPSFPNPTVKMPEYLAALDSFSDLRTQSSTGDRDIIAAKNAMQTIVINMYQANGNYVNSVATTLEQMISSGYAISKDRQPIRLETPVINKLLQGDNPGDMEMRVKRQRGQKSMEYHYSLDPISEKTVWTVITSSRSRQLFTNLSQGQKYWFRAVVIGSNSQRLFSEPVSQFVQNYGIANAI